MPPVSSGRASSAWETSCKADPIGLVKVEVDVKVRLTVTKKAPQGVVVWWRSLFKGDKEINVTQIDGRAPYGNRSQTFGEVDMMLCLLCFAVFLLFFSFSSFVLYV